LSEIAVGALMAIVSIYLALTQRWVVGLAKLVEIKDEEYPGWIRNSRLFPIRHRIFQYNFAAVLFITGVVFVATGLGA
jgi:hypothetical protein